jgi:hypothetical protein
MAQNVFADPAGVRGSYAWDYNHEAENETGLDAEVQATANTAGVGFVLQQDDPSPRTMSLTGTILKRAHLVQMLQWTHLSQLHSIYFTDFAGDKYEVVITGFTTARKRGRNRRDPANAPLWYWTYTLNMLVLRELIGPYSEAAL